MSIQSEINRLTQAVSDTYSALNAKGATMPAAQTSANLAATVESIPVTAATQVTATLGVNGWAPDASGLYAQSVSVTGLTADTPVVVVDVVLPTNDTASRDTILAAWLAGPGANGTVQGAWTLTFYADTAPDVNIPIVVGVVG